MDRCAAHGDDCRLIQQERDSGCFHPALEFRPVFDQVVISFDDVNAEPGLHLPNESESFVEVGQSVVDQIAGEKDQIGTKIVGCCDNIAQYLAGSESSDMHVADLRNGGSIQFLWQIKDRQYETPDTNIV